MRAGPVKSGSALLIFERKKNEERYKEDHKEKTCHGKEICCHWSLSEKEKDQKEESMIDVVYAIFSTILIGLVPRMELGAVDQWALAIYCRDTQMLIWIALVYKLMPIQQMNIKTACLIYLIHCFCETQLYFSYILLSDKYYLTVYSSYFAIFITVCMLNLTKQYKYKSDKIDSCVCFCFWQPNRDKSLVPTILGLPFGGVSIFCDGHLYGYRWGSKKYLKEKIKSPDVLEQCFIVHNTGILPSKEFLTHLNNAVGTDAGFLRVKCIMTIRKALKVLGNGYRASLFEYIPAIYAAKVFKHER